MNRLIDQSIAALPKWPIEPSEVEKPPVRTVSGVMAETMVNWGVRQVFGMVGHSNLGLADALRVQEEAGRLTYYGIRHEGAASFACSAYGKLTGELAACFGIAGPGSTNLLTGLCEALNAGTPMVVITGNTHRAHSWKHMTQEARQIEMLGPAVKAVLRIERVERIPELMRRAFAVATGGRPGPVVVDVPEDVAHGTHPFEPVDFEIDPRWSEAPALRAAPAVDDVQRAAAMLRAARRPLILVLWGAMM